MGVEENITPSGDSEISHLVMDWQFPTDSVCPPDDEDDEDEEAMVVKLTLRCYPPGGYQFLSLLFHW